MKKSKKIFTVCLSIFFVIAMLITSVVIFRTPTKEFDSEVVESYDKNGDYYKKTLVNNHDGTVDVNIEINKWKRKQVIEPIILLDMMALSDEDFDNIADSFTTVFTNLVNQGFVVRPFFMIYGVQCTNQENVTEYGILNMRTITGVDGLAIPGVGTPVIETAGFSVNYILDGEHPERISAMKNWLARTKTSGNLTNGLFDAGVGSRLDRAIASVPYFTRTNNKKFVVIVSDGIISDSKAHANSHTYNQTLEDDAKLRVEKMKLLEYGGKTIEGLDLRIFSIYKKASGSNGDHGVNLLKEFASGSEYQASISDNLVSKINNVMPWLTSDEATIESKFTDSFVLTDEYNSQGFELIGTPTVKWSKYSKISGDESEYVPVPVGQVNWVIDSPLTSDNINAGTYGFENPIKYPYATINTSVPGKVSVSNLKLDTNAVTETMAYQDNSTYDGYRFFINYKLRGSGAPDPNSPSSVVENYVVSFDANGGTGAPADIRGEGTVTIPSKEPTRTGYAFSGWAESSSASYADYSPNETISINKNTTLYAVWDGNDYTITFNTDGGSEISPMTKKCGDTIVAPSNPSKTGYTFNGWSPALPATMPAENISVTAQWTKKSFNVQYSTAHGVKPAAETVEYNGFATCPEITDDSGEYTFDGWYYDNAKFTLTTPVTQNMTLHAHWSVADKYNAYFENIWYNDGTTTSSEEHAANGALDNFETKYITERTGYSFDGWKIYPADADKYSNANGVTNEDKTAYAAGAGYFTTFPTEMPDTDFTAVAQWKKNDYSVEFIKINPDKSEESVKTLNVNIGNNVKAPAVDSIAGYGFSWEKDNFIVNESVIGEMNPDNKLVIYGEYELKNYTVKWIAKDLNNNETTVKSETVKLGDTVTCNDVPSEIPGYGFSWDNTSYTLDEAKAAALDSANKTEIVIYGRYYAKNYEIQWVVTLPSGEEQTVKENDVVPFNNYINPPSADTIQGYNFAWDSTPSRLTSELAATSVNDVITVRGAYTPGESGYTVEVYLMDTDGNYADESSFTKYITATTGDTVSFNPENVTDLTDGFTLDDSHTEYSEEFTVSAEGTDVVKVYFKRDKYTITYNPNGGSDVESVLLYWGAEIPDATSEKEGNSLVGWNYTDDANNAYEETTMPRFNLTANAEWKQFVKYTVETYQQNTDKAGYDLVNSEELSAEADTVVEITLDDVSGFTKNEDMSILSGTVSEENPLVLKKYYDRESYNITISFSGAGENTPDNIVLPFIYGSEYNVDVPDVPGYTPDKSVINGTMGDTPITESVVYAPNKYSLVFKVDGEVYATVEADYGAPIEAPADPDKTGYTFTGWDKQLPETMPLNGDTYEALWSANTYSITYLFNNDSENIIKELTIENKINENLPDTPVKTGHSFAGYIYKDGEDNILNVNDDTYMPAKNLTAEAQWTVNTYTFTLDPGNGDDPIIYTGEYGTEITPPADPERPGYTFDGWEPEFPDKIPAEDMTIEAKWSINEYSVEFDANGGNGEMTEISDIKVGDTVSLAECSFANGSAIFAGWTTAADGTGKYFADKESFEFDKDVIALTDNNVLKLYAQWIAFTKTNNINTETYVKPGDTVEYTIEYKNNVKTNNLVITDVLPEGLDYVSDDNNGVYDSETHTVTWTFENETADVFDITITLVTAVNDKANSNIVNKASAVNDLLSFDNGNSDEPSAVVKVASYKVTYDLNGAEGTTPVDENVYAPDEEVTAADEKDFSYEGKAFFGWNTKKDGTGKHIDALQKFTLDSDTVLYAMWGEFTVTSEAENNRAVPGSKLTYTIKVTFPENAQDVIVTDIISDGLKLVESEDFTVIEGVAVKEIENIAAGDTVEVKISADILDKFADSSDISSKEIVNTANVKIGEKVLSASASVKDKIGYIKVTYTLPDDVKGTVPVDNNYYAPGDKVKAPDKGDITKDGYTFVGWNDEAGNLVKPGEEMELKENINLVPAFGRLVKTSKVEADGKITYKISVTIPNGIKETVVTDTLPAELKLISYTEADNIKASVKDNVVSWTITKLDKVSDYEVSVVTEISPDAKPGATISNKAGADFLVSSGYEAVNSDIKVPDAKTEYKVTYMNKGAVVQTDSKLYAKGEKAKVLEPGKLDNTYVFAGWNDKSDYSGKVYSAGDEITVNDNVTLYAMTIYNNKEIVNSTDSEITYKISFSVPYNGERVTVKDTLPTGLNFSSLGTISKDLVVNYSDGILTAEIDRSEADKVYEINFTTALAEGVKATDVENVAEITVNGKTFVSPKAVVDKPNNNNNNNNNNDNPIVETYRVVYSANGAEGTAPVDSNRYAAGTYAEVLSADSLTKNGYEFAGWCMNSNGRGDLYVEGYMLEIGGNVTLYAIFTRNGKAPTIVNPPYTGSAAPALAIFCLISGIAAAAFVLTKKKED